MTKRGRILIVDDALDNLHVLLAILKDGWDVQAATSGSKALKLAQRSPQPDLILLDVMMPELDGFQTFSKLREDPLTRNIPVIFVTGLSDSDDQVRGLECGAVDYIIKPFVPPLVRARLRNHLELKRHRDSLEETVQQVQAELEVAKHIQFSMLPPAQFQDRRHLGCQLGCLLRPARAVGGDLYDYFFQADNKLFFVAGDVSDKGVPAALFMVKVSTLMRLLAPSADDPGRLLSLMNEQLCKDNQECMFVTLVCGLFDLESGEVCLASGGHEPPLQVEKGGASRFLDFEGGPALGLHPDAVFTNHRFLLGPEQSLLLYTDGVTDASDEKNERYGPDRLLGHADRHSQESPGELVASIAAALGAFSTGVGQFDDITLLALSTPGSELPPPK